MRGRVRSSARHYVYGLLMGGADIVPGVSGGTMALIVGIYERLISSVRAAAAAPVMLLRGDVAAARQRLAEVEWGLVVPLAAGILTALVVGAHFISDLLERFPAETRAVFFGLIAGSLVIPWRRISRVRAVHVVVAIVSAVVAFVLVGVPPQEVADPALITVFLAAAVAICAMILPGVSGAFLLLVLGMYGPTLRAVAERDLLYIAVFGLGAAIGLGLFSKVLEYLLEGYHDGTMAALVGLMAGSLRALWPFLDGERNLLPPPDTGALVEAAALMLVGFVVVTVIARFGSASERDPHRAAPTEG